MKRTLLLLTFLFLVPISKAQITYDTLSSIQVGMGIFHTHVVEHTKPWNINVLEVDLSNPFNFVETVKANDRLAGYEKTSSMAARKSYPGHVVVGAVNGDFYAGGGVPTNTQLLKGEMLKLPINRQIIAFDENKKPMIETTSFSGKLIFNDTSTTIHNVNADRLTNQLIYYNSYKGPGTATNQFGTELVVEPVNSWAVNDTVKLVVKTKRVDLGNTTMLGNQAVLSGHGTSKDFLNNINVGDTVQMYLGLNPGLKRLKEAIGGSEKMIHNGLNVAGWPERHPRTAAGFNQDSTKLYLVTVDGRQSLSVGMTLSELADFMLRIGVYQAINLDGGGSTTMVVRDEVVNHPSDGAGERSVANALLVLTSAPQGSLSQIGMIPDFNKIYRGETIQFDVRGWDEYYNPVQLDPNQVQFSLSHNFGTISQSGLFTGGNDADTGYVFVDYNGLKDTSLVVVKSIEHISITPQEAVTDTIHTIEFRTSAFDLDSIYRPLAATEYTWTSSDESVGIVDSAGVFYGKSAGTTKVFAEYNGNIDSAAITVIIREGEEQLDPLDVIGSWQLDGENINLANSSLTVSTDTFSQGTGSFKIDYEFTYNSTSINWVYLKTDIPITGVPDKIWLEAKSDGAKHHISYFFSDENDELFRLNTLQFAEEKNYFDTLQVNFSGISPVVPGYLFNYPIRLKQINIKLGSTKQQGQVYSGTIYLDNLKIFYPSTVTSIKDEGYLPGNFNLYQNYPNPFNPTTNITFEIEESSYVSLNVYDVLGKKVAELVNERLNAGRHNLVWNASDLPSGVYFYTLNRDGIQLSKKMVLLK